MERRSITEYLKERPYPGRGILIGGAKGYGDIHQGYYVIAYFIMGRSENSRNRVFELTEDGIRTRAYDESKMTDPSLIIYHPVRVCGADIIVTNGDQTDTVRDYLKEGKSFTEALRTRTYEPDEPNWTPRISALLHRNGSFEMSILKTISGPTLPQRSFYEYGVLTNRFISTYEGFGGPVPSFSGEPLPVEIPFGSAEELAEAMWDSLNKDNRVSLFVQYIGMQNGFPHTVIINKHTGCFSSAPKASIWSKEERA